MIPIYKPYLTENMKRFVLEAIESSWISSKGKYLDLIETKLKDLISCRNIIMTNNGTAATHLIVKGLLHLFPNINKLIVPTNVYVACWNTVLYENNLKLIPIDANINTWNIDIEKVNNSLDTNTAVLVVHNLGNIIDINKIHTDKIIEDNCEGFTGKCDKYFSGTESIASSISFFGNKIITCGEGGAVITKNNSVYDFLYHISRQGQTKERYIHDSIAYNYRMTNIQAAMLYSQLESIDIIIKEKKRVFAKYKDNLSNLNNLAFQEILPNTEHANWMFAVRIRNNKSYHNIEMFMNDKGIEVRPLFYPMSRHKHLQKFANINEEKVASLLNREVVVLPSYPALSNNDIEYITNSIINYLKYDFT